MNLSSDMARYFVWATVVVAGALFAVVDRRLIGRPVFGVLLAAGVGGGIIVTQASPFTFGAGGYYMQGVLVAAGSGLALTGYVFAAGWQFARRHIGRHGSA